jgi:hypothetical protein
MPEAGLRVSQVALSLAAQVRVPPPVLLMVRAWAAGLPPPCWEVKDRLDGLMPIVGGAATAKVTGTVTEVAPVAVIVIVPVWLPVARPPVAAVRVTVPLPVPEIGDAVSQAALSLTDHVNVPPPVLLMVRVWFAGLTPPCVAAKVRLVGLAPIAGGTGAAVTVRLTGTETGEAPMAESVIVPVWIPVASVPSKAVTVTAPLPVPEAGATDSHAASSLAVHVNVPPPVLLMASA